MFAKRRRCRESKFDAYVEVHQGYLSNATMNCIAPAMVVHLQPNPAYCNRFRAFTRIDSVKATFPQWRVVFVGRDIPLL